MRVIKRYCVAPVARALVVFPSLTRAIVYSVLRFTATQREYHWRSYTADSIRCLIRRNGRSAKRGEYLYLRMRVIA